MMLEHETAPPLPRGAEVVWLPTAAEIAELDRHATESGAIPERALIESAGRELAHSLQNSFPVGPVLALAGSGHNGADALAAVRTLAAWGREVSAVGCGSRPPEPDVLAGWSIDLRRPDELPSLLAESSVVIDGLLGTGVTGPPREPIAALIRTANESGLPIVAVDGPSGADFTTGIVPGECIQATLTVSLGWPKLGLLRFPARSRCGDLVAVEIGFPPPPEPMGFRAITDAWVAATLVPRSADGHKGRAGYVAIVAGQSGMAGASVLSARGALRAGAGIVKVVGDPANREIVQKSVPESIFVPWDEPDSVRDAIDWAHAVALGPGLGAGDEARSLVETVLEATSSHGKPLVLDADGLNVWAGEATELGGRIPAGSLVTPHPGELSRLMAVPLEEITSDPASAVREAGRVLGCAVLLKGSPSLVADGDAPVRVSTTGDSALATGGVGDVLTGLIGAYLAAGMAAADAAAAALHVSGLAALLAPEPVGHAAGDLPERLPAARARLRGVDAVSYPYLFVLPAPRGGSPEPPSAGAAPLS
jgi:NAD(P)H-hydrate epimerase